MQKYFDTEDEIEESLKSLSDATCPHCGRRGTLIRHDYIWYSGGKQNGMRGKRVYCDSHKAKRKGCGRTFTLWLSDTLRGRCLRAAALMQFILGLLAGSSTWKAWRDAETGMSVRSGYRTLKWLEENQSVVRTELFGLSPPSLNSKEKTPLLETLKILKEAFGINAVSAYQKTRQISFP